MIKCLSYSGYNKNACELTVDKLALIKFKVVTTIEYNLIQSKIVWNRKSIKLTYNINLIPLKY